MFQWFNEHPIAIRAAQAIVVSAVALAVAFGGRRQGIMLFGQTLIAIVRGLVQIILVGLVLVFILDKPPIVSIPVLAVMIITAAIISGRRSRGTPAAFQGALYG